MPTIDIRKITAGLSPTWSGYLRDWDRTLRAANHPETTRYCYLLSTVQLGRYLGAECDEFEDWPGHGPVRPTGRGTRSRRRRKRVGL
jgi:hypothetical protein